MVGLTRRVKPRRARPSCLDLLSPVIFPTGFHVEFDLSKPSGSRVRSLDILCTQCRVPRYEPVEDETVYTVVLPSYMVTGGDGFSMIKNETLKHNSGEGFGYFSGFQFFWGDSELKLFRLTLLFSFQVTWTFQSCPATSCREGEFIRLLKDASSSTTQRPDCGDRCRHWFYWFHWCYSGLCEEACRRDFTQEGSFLLFFLKLNHMGT